MKKVDRRSFLKRLMPAAAGLVVAPTLGEALYYGPKKYFFMEGRNPLAIEYAVEAIDMDKLIEASPYGIRYWQVYPGQAGYLGLSRRGTDAS